VTQIIAIIKNQRADVPPMRESLKFLKFNQFTRDYIGRDFWSAFEHEKPRKIFEKNSVEASNPVSTSVIVDEDLTEPRTLTFELLYEIVTNHPFAIIDLVPFANKLHALNLR